MSLSCDIRYKHGQEPIRLHELSQVFIIDYSVSLYHILFYQDKDADLYKTVPFYHSCYHGYQTHPYILFRR